MMPPYIDETPSTGEGEMVDVEIDAYDDIMAIDDSAIAGIFFVGSKSTGWNCEKKTREYHAFVE